MPKQPAELTEFAAFHQAYVSQYIELADAKAGAVFTVAGGVVGYLLSQPGYRTSLGLGDPSGFLAIATLAVLCLCFALAFAVIRPRGLDGTGPIFFGSVAKYTCKEFLAQIEGLSAAELAEARLAHCHALTVVCREKYHYLRAAIWIGLGGLILAGTSIANLGL